MSRVYLDHAATSWPKPPAVLAAIENYHSQLGCAVGRSSTRPGAALQRLVDQARQSLARLFNAPSADSILMTYSGTDSLNTVLHGWLRQGDHVVTSEAEHNSVLRPLKLLQEHLGLSIDYVPVDAEGRISLTRLKDVLKPTTRLLALTHASNVTGTLQPVDEVAGLVRSLQVPFLLDAAQTAGHVPIDVQALSVDFLAAPGHKGLQGPLGTGVLYVHPDRQPGLIPLRQGGTGTSSELEEIAETGPDRFEAGNHNAPGIVGLGAAVADLLQQTIPVIREHELTLTRQILEGLSALPMVKVFGPRTAEERVGTVSFQVEGYDPQTVATLLETEFGIETRAGLHCAPRIHAAMGTLNQGGTVRVSVGPATTAEDVAVLVQALQSLTGI